MGVYIFRCGDNWLKVGHHLVCTRRPNAYYRVAGRGFESCKHPEELSGKLWMNDIELLAWYPTLTREHEKFIHNEGKHERIGEFHPYAKLYQILEYCESVGGMHVEITCKERSKAEAWGKKRCTQAKRRRQKKKA